LQDLPASIPHYPKLVGKAKFIQEKELRERNPARSTLKLYLRRLYLPAEPHIAVQKTIDTSRAGDTIRRRELKNNY
jgi:hypothetical protein